MDPRELWSVDENTPINSGRSTLLACAVLAVVGVLLALSFCEPEIRIPPAGPGHNPNAVSGPRATATARPLEMKKGG